VIILIDMMYAEEVQDLSDLAVDLAEEGRELRAVSREEYTSKYGLVTSAWLQLQST
jgi:hypothetical protein